MSAKVITLASQWVSQLHLDNCERKLQYICAGYFGPDTFELRQGERKVFYDEINMIESYLPNILSFILRGLVILYKII